MSFIFAIGFRLIALIAWLAIFVVSRTSYMTSWRLPPKVAAPIAPKTDAPSAQGLLDQATELMLGAYPESASSAGIDCE